MHHLVIIPLIVAYTLVGAFIFTVGVIWLSLVGWIKLADAEQRQKLFKLLLVELVVGCLAFFLNFLAFSPAAVVKQVGDEAVAQHQERLRSLLARIDTLPMEKVREVGSTLSTSLPLLDKAIVPEGATEVIPIETEPEAAGGAGQSLQTEDDVTAACKAALEADHTVAKEILKMQVVLGARSVADVDAWEKLIGPPL
ncbi:MAG: hypothetical protein OEV73_01915 [Desulfobulbaceae bacterium]|nr:hypothetical protein [Desulfobulbaceae bacterium]